MYDGVVLLITFYVNRVLTHDVQVNFCVTHAQTSNVASLSSLEVPLKHSCLTTLLAPLLNALASFQSEDRAELSPFLVKPLTALIQSISELRKLVLLLKCKPVKRSQVQVIESGHPYVGGCSSVHVVSMER